MATMIDAPPDGALAAAKAYLRIDSEAEDVLLGLLIAAAVAICERFTGLALFTRDRNDLLSVADGAWRLLPATPVSAITAVAIVDVAGVATALPAASYAIDINGGGDGWVRVGGGPGARVRVSYRAGLAADWVSLPPALAQGVVRLAAHLYAHRDEADDAGPPAAVAALWRPWRRMRLS
jgi:uncharacterized phiE125 gp8 family phage protein